LKTNYYWWKQSQEVVAACRKIDNLLLPEYYPEYSSEKIITMDWMEGVHLSQFKNSDPIADKIGQALWDFVPNP
jgi:predicted unusual protein kinase regulating ubiquinone biosynthesis (AarF/ABC1/UbiB family)